jgi:hypothetical protein
MASADGVAAPSGATTPPHYSGKVTPWDLEKCMKSSGNLFVDARRTDAIEYCFRIKDDLLGDLVKARDNINAAIEDLEKWTNKPLSSLIGQSVLIEWNDEDCDWHNFMLLNYDMADGFLELSGETDDEGYTSDGKPFHAHMSEIKTIKPRNP